MRQVSREKSRGNGLLEARACLSLTLAKIVAVPGAACALETRKQEAGSHPASTKNSVPGTLGLTALCTSLCCTGMLFAWHALRENSSRPDMCDNMYLFMPV